MPPAEFNGYTQDFIKEFIQLYHALPCLWNVKCKGYKDRLLRNKAYDMLVQKLRQMNERADKDVVVRKINTLRTAFRREHKKVLMSKIMAKDPENIYKSSLWYYDLMKFVTEQDDQEAIMKNENYKNENTSLVLPIEQIMSIENNIEKMEPPSPISSRSSTPNNFRPIILHTEGSCELEYSSATPMVLSPTKEKNPSMNYVEDCCTDTKSAYVDVTSKQIVSCTMEDDLKTFGLYVASKLKKSTERQCIIAERIIAEVLLRANLGTLDENTTLTMKSPSHCCLVMSDR